MITLVITVAVLIILSATIIITNNGTPSEATYAKFVQEVTNVQMAVEEQRLKNAQNGDSEEQLNEGFEKVILINAPNDFISAPGKPGEVVGYKVELDKIEYTNAEYGQKYEDASTVLTFEVDDVYVYDATGAVYYVKGLHYNDTKVHSLEHANAAIKSTEDGPIISNIIVESGELEDGTKTNAKAKIIVSAFPRNGGELNVLVRSSIAEKEPNGTFATQVSRNGIYTIVVAEANGGRTVAKVTISGLVEATEPPSNLSIKINNGDAYTHSNEVKLTLRADGASKMMITKNNPIRPKTTDLGWIPYSEEVDYDLGIIQGKVTLYAWFMDEFLNVTEKIVKATITYDSTPPYMDAPTVVVAGPTVIITSKQTDNVSSKEYIDATIKYGYRKYDGTEGYYESYTWSDSRYVDFLESKTYYEFVTYATDEAEQSSISMPTKAYISYDYTIKFKPNGGSGEFTNLYASDGESVTLPVITDSNLTRDGYYFAGWSEDAAESYTSETLYKSGTEYSPTGINVIKELYAIWEPRTDIPYYVYHYTEKLHGSDQYELRITEEHQGTMGNDVVVNTSEIENGLLKGFIKDPLHPSSVLQAELKADGSTKLKVYYKRRRFNLTVKGINGTVGVGGESIPYETEVQLTSYPLQGYKFNIWTMQNGTDIQNFLDGIESQNTRFKMVARDEVVTANFIPIIYKITYDLRGGAVSSENPGTYTRETPEFTLVNPTKLGYDFAGWTGSFLEEPTIEVIINGQTVEEITDREYTATYSPRDELLTMTRNPNVQTNTNVTITVDCLDPNLTLEYKVGANGEWNRYDKPFEVEANTMVYSRAKEEGILIDEEDILIDNIDKVPPEIQNIEINEDWQSGTAIEFKVTGTDDIEVKGYAISTTSTVPSTGSFASADGILEVATEGKNYVWVMDTAGNIVGDYIYAWDISVNEDNKVYAVFTKNNEFIIVGEGETKSYDDKGTPYNEHVNKAESIEIREGITGIDDNVIARMTNVKTISIPKTLRMISEDAMIFTNNYTNITIAPGNDYFTYANYTLFDKDKTKIYIHSRTDTNSTYTIPSTVTTINNFAFYDNDSIKEIKVTSNPSVNEAAFKECSELLKITGVIGGTKIAREAFAECRKLDTLTLSETMETLEYRAFYNTYKLSGITITKKIKSIVPERGVYELFKNIGIETGNPSGKGIVRYYQSSAIMNLYALDYPNEAEYDMIDDVPATLLEIRLSSPTSGVHPAGTKLTFIARYDEKLNAELTTTVPTLTIKIGEGNNITITNGVISENSITYEYIVPITEEGKVKLVQYVGLVYDVPGNPSPIDTTELVGEDITIDTYIKLEEQGRVTYFTKLQDAINAAQTTPEESSKITLLKDITESVVVPVNKDINLDLNGKTMRTKSGVTGIVNNAKLTIRNSIGIVAETETAIKNESGAILEIDSTTITCNDETLPAIINNETATMTISHTEIASEKTSIRNIGTLNISDSVIQSNRDTTIANGANAILNITSSEVSTESSSIEHPAINNVSTGIVRVNNSTVEALYGNAVKNNGSLEITNGSVLSSSDSATIDNDGTTTISGGTTTINSTSTTNAAIINDGTLNISAGKIKSISTEAIKNNKLLNIIGGSVESTSTTVATIVNSLASTMTIENTSIISENQNAILNNGGLAIESGSTIRSENGNTISNLENGILTINGGTIITNSTSHSAIDNKSEATINSGTITSTGEFGIRNTDGGKLTINGGTINVSKDSVEVVGIYTSSTELLEIKNLTLNVTSANANAIGIKIENAKVKIDNATIDATSTNETGYGIFNNNGEITYGVADGSVNGDIPNTEGSTYGYYSTNGMLYFYDGKFIGEIDKSLEGQVTFKPKQSFVRITSSGTRETSMLAVDFVKPSNVVLTANTIEWTNNTVTLTGSATDDYSGIIAYAFTTSETTPTENEWQILTGPEMSITKTKEYEEIISIYFHVKDLAGNTAVSNVIDVLYDVTDPIITSVEHLPEEWTDADVTITLKATDSESGVDGYYFTKTYVDKDSLTNEWTEIAATNNFVYEKQSDNTIWHIYVKDQAGNTAYVSHEIKNVDKVFPTIDVTITNIENGKTTILIEAFDEDSGIVSVKLNNVSMTLKDSATKEHTKETTYTITTPETIEIAATDDAGNITTYLTESYLVSYQKNAGVGTEIKQLKLKDEGIEIVECSYVREGYEFVTWNTKSDGTGTNHPVGSVYTENANLTLYAIWKDITPPEIVDVYISDEWTPSSSNNFKVNVNATDNGIITGYAITSTNTLPTTWQESNHLEHKLVDGICYVWVRDTGDNTDVAEIKVYNISKNKSDKNAYALLKENAEKEGTLKLLIGGNGETAGYTESTIPWKTYQTDISSVEVQDEVSKLGAKLLCNLSSMEQLILSSSVTSVADDTFIHTHNYKNVHISGINFRYENGIIFNTNKEIAYASSTKITMGTVVLPSTVRRLAPYVFENSKMTSLTTTMNIDISEGAFYNATNLRKIDSELKMIGGTSVGAKAFEGCTSLTSIVLSTQLTTLKERAFYNCTKLTGIEIPKTVTTLGTAEIFTNIGINAGTDYGKGVVYYFESNAPMVAYATTSPTKDEAKFIALDDIPPEVHSVIINDGDVSTTNNVVNIKTNATDNHDVYKMYISQNGEKPSASASGWTNWSNDCTYEIESVNKEVTLYVWVKDTSENISETYKSDSIILAVNDFEPVNGNLVVQYKDTTGKDYYEFREMGYTISYPEFTITTSGVEGVDHKVVGEYEIRYELEFLDTIVDSYIKTVDIIENTWDTAEHQDDTGKYTFVKYPNRNYAKIVKFNNSNSVTMLEIPEKLYLDGVEYRVIDIGNGTDGIARATEAKVSKLVLPDTLINVSDKAFSNFTAISNIEYGAHLMTFGAYSFTNIDNEGNIYSRETYESFTLKENVREVKEFAFARTLINKLVISEGVKAIYGGAFNGETRTNTPYELEIPASIDTLGTQGKESPFIFTELSKISVDLNNTKYKSVDSGLGVTTKDGTVFMQFPSKSNVTEYTLPEETTEISIAAFGNSDKLEMLTGVEKLKNIGSYAFLSCISLTKIMDIENVITIGESAFRSSGITSFVMPAGVTYIEKETFDSTKLEYIIIPSNIVEIATNAFANISTMDYAIIEGTPILAANVFANDTSLKYLVILDADDVLSISGTPSLASATIVYVLTEELEASYEEATNWSQLNESKIESIIEILGDRVQYIEYGGTYTEEGVRMYDETFTTGNGTCTAMPEFTVTRTSNLNVDIIGEYQITYTLKRNGTTLTSMTRTIHIIDRIPPEISDVEISDSWTPGETLKLEVTAEDEYDGTDLTYAITATDDSTGATWQSSKVLTVVGETNYIHAKDKSGNISTRRALVWDRSLNSDKKIYAFLDIDGELVLDGTGETKVYTSNPLNAANISEVTKITVEEGITVIANHMFSKMENVNQISLPASLTSIGEWAFSETNNFDNITVASGNTSFKAPDVYTLTSFDESIIYLHSRKDPKTTYNVGANVTAIWNSAFYKNENITSITLNGNTNIGAYAFRECSKLTTITGEIGNTFIGSGAFWGDDRLANITIRKTVVTLGTGIFTEVPGPVYYYTSCTVMKNYARTYPQETAYSPIDDVDPTTDAPTLRASSATIVVTSNQIDIDSAISKVEYNIRKAGESYGENWQLEAYFSNLDQETTYYIKTRTTDSWNNDSESVEASIKTKPVPTEITFTYTPEGPTNTDVVVSIIWPETKIEELYGSGWPQGTKVTKQICIRKLGETEEIWTEENLANVVSTITVEEYGTTVLARLYDGHNYTSGTKSITAVNIDKEKPTGSFLINGGATTTLSENVTLTLTASDNRNDVGYGVTWYYVSENATQPAPGDMSKWINWNGNGDYDFTISSAREVKTVYVWYMDSARNVSDVSTQQIEMLANAVRVKENGEVRHYDSLREAVDSTLNTSPALPSELLLYKDIVDEGQIEITEGRNIVLDMNGWNITNSATKTIATLVNNGILKIENNDEDGVASSITATTSVGDAYGIYNFGILSVDGVSISATAANGTAVGIFNIDAE